jgi:hypothetical protein
MPSLRTLLSPILCFPYQEKSPAKKPKNYAKLSQKEKFMAAAQEFEAEQTGETFLRSFKTIAKHKAKKGSL